MRRRYNDGADEIWKHLKEKRRGYARVVCGAMTEKKKKGRH